MASFYKLTYFNVTALGEVSRFLMKYGGIEFEDDRFEKEQWPELKQIMPFGQVPVLTANDKQYNQSIALARFFAKQVNLVGKDEWEDLEIDSVVDTFNDLRIKIALYFYEPDAAIKESRKGPLFDEILPYYMTRLDKIAEDNDGYLACRKLTWADMYFVSLLDYLNILTDIDLTNDYPNLEAVKNHVMEIPAIKEWIETRPNTDVEFFSAFK